MNDVKISGAGVIGGGEFKKVTISGSGKVSGDISCESFKSSGAAKVHGSVKCGSFGTSGAVKVDGGVECCGEVRISGAAKIGEAMSAEELHSSGALVVGGNLVSGVIHSSGELNIGGDVSAEEAHMSGKTKISGLLNAEKVRISFDEANGCQIGQIGGGRIEIEYTGRAIGFFKRLSGGCGHVTSIEADSVEIENISAETVRAIDLTIGDGCVIDTVEYSGTLTVSEHASVKNTVKL